jgi:hypothetical protein
MKESKSPERYWQTFPNFEKLLAEERPPLLGAMEGTCRRLDAVLQTGSPQERARAQSALTAYARTLELYRQLTEIRDKALLDATRDEQQSNASGR